MKKTAFKIWLIISLFTAAHAVNAQQFIGGAYYNDLTLTKENSPYIVTENLIISENAILSIEAGVEVFFEEEVSFKIQGTIQVSGTPEEPVLFDIREETAEQWAGITLLEQSESDTIPDFFSYAVFTRTASTAISSYYRSDLTVENCTFYDNSSYTMKLFSNTNTVIANNHLSIGSFGIYISSRGETKNIILENNTIDNFFSVGILILGQDALTAHNMFKDNTISNCLYGIQIAGGEKTHNNTFQNNLLFDNEVGFYIYSGYNKLIENVVYDNNYGVRFQGNLSSGGNHNNLVRNLLFNNDQAVLFEDKCIKNVLDSNRVFNNQKGMSFSSKSVAASGGNTIVNNIFENNPEYDIKLNASPQDSLSYNSFSKSDSSIFLLLDEFDQSAPYNWWGTDDTTVIESMIYDREDNEEMGRVLYEPFLDVPGTDSPLPPENVAKHLAYDTVMVSWEMPEEDIAGFRVYYQKINAFQYEEVYEVTDTNRFALPGADIHAQIAVTAFNDEATGHNDQQQMNESWFAIAELYPFSGNDTIICQEEVLEFTQATAFDYDSLRWVTDGEGVLSDEDSLHARYIHDEQEVESELVFTLYQYNNGHQRKDSINVEFKALPEVFAGNDTIILVDSLLKTDQAVSHYADSVQWTTSGDGFFEEADSVISNYQPGNDDAEEGFVELILSVFSHCGQFTDTMNVTIKPSFSISGSVLQNNTEKGSVKILMEHSDEFRLLSETVVESNNEFLFPAVPESETHLVYIPDNNTSYLPTYYVNKIRWENAHQIKIDADVYDVDINPQKSHFTLPPGQASIEGTVNEVEPAGSMKPFIYLTDSAGRVLQWDMPGQNGEYYFSNLPYGNYRIGTEKVGVPYFLTGIFTLSPDNQEEQIVNISIDGKKVEADISNQQVIAEVYPVLTKDYLHLRFNRDVDNIMLNWYTLSGNGIKTQKIQNAGKGEIIDLDMQDLVSGMYILEIRLNNTPVQTKKIMKQ